MLEKIYSTEAAGNSFSAQFAYKAGEAEVKVNVTFEKEGGKLAKFRTGNENVQKAIENSEFYTLGLIKLAQTIDIVDVAKEPKAKAKSKAKKQEAEKEVEEKDVVMFADITDVAEAAEILKSEPYKVAARDLSTPAKILVAAKKVGVEFPSIKINEE